MRDLTQKTTGKVTFLTEYVKDGSAYAGDPIILDAEDWDEANRIADERGVRVTGIAAYDYAAGEINEDQANEIIGALNEASEAVSH